MATTVTIYRLCARGDMENDIKLYRQSGNRNSVTLTDSVAFIYRF